MNEHSSYVNFKSIVFKLANRQFQIQIAKPQTHFANPAIAAGIFTCSKERVISYVNVWYSPGSTFIPHMRKVNFVCFCYVHLLISAVTKRILGLIFFFFFY